MQKLQKIIARLFVNGFESGTGTVGATDGLTMGTELWSTYGNRTVLWSTFLYFGLLFQNAPLARLRPSRDFYDFSRHRINCFRIYSIYFENVKNT